MFQIPRRGAVDAIPFLREAGAVAGAVPALFLRVPFQRAAKVRTALYGGREQAGCGFQSVKGKLRMKNGAGRGKYVGKRILFSLNQVA